MRRDEEQESALASAKSRTRDEFRLRGARKQDPRQSAVITHRIEIAERTVDPNDGAGSHEATRYPNHELQNTERRTRFGIARRDEAAIRDIGGLMQTSRLARRNEDHPVPPSLYF